MREQASYVSKYSPGSSQSVTQNCKPRFYSVVVSTFIFDMSSFETCTVRTDIGSFIVINSLRANPNRSKKMSTENIRAHRGWYVFVPEKLSGKFRLSSGN